MRRSLVYHVDDYLKSRNIMQLQMPYPSPLLPPTPTASTTTVTIDSYQIDALLVIRCMIYLILVYRAIEILLTQSDKLTAKDRITQRYSFANAELIGSLNREDCELMTTTIRNTIANVKITEEGIKPRQRQDRSAKKSVKFSEKHQYYDPVVFAEEGAEEVTPPVVGGGEVKEGLEPLGRIEKPPGIGKRVEPVAGDKEHKGENNKEQEKKEQVEGKIEKVESKQVEEKKIEETERKQPEKQIQSLKKNEEEFKQAKETPSSQSEEDKLIEKN